MDNAPPIKIQPPTVRAVPNPPPFPDRSVSTTFWISLCLGLIGLDHFYLRSPRTGIVKALTFGGLGLWWIWDVLQLLFEPTRSAEYGLTAPFNLANGIGQGQLTTEPTYIRQRTDYFMWFLSAFLDMFGITALLEGRPGAFVRRLIDGGFMLVFLATGSIFGLVLAAILAFFTIVPSFFTISAIFDPEHLAKKGVAIPQNMIKLLNLFESWTDIIGPNATAVVRYDIGLSAVGPKNAANTFGYDNEETLQAEQEAATATESDSGSGKKGMTSWPASLFLGSILGAITLNIMNLLSWIPVVRTGMLAADGYFGLVRVSRGEVPDIPGGLGGMIPGVGGLAGGLLKKASVVTDVLKKGEELVGKASAVTGALEKGKELMKKASVVTDALKKGEEIVEKASAVTGALEKGASGLMEKAGAVTDALGAAKKTLTEPEPVSPSVQKGGARKSDSSLSTESLVLGTTVIALIAGGAIKMAVDTLVSS